MLIREPESFSFQFHWWIRRSSMPTDPFLLHIDYLLFNPNAVISGVSFIFCSLLDFFLAMTDQKAQKFPKETFKCSGYP